MRLKIIKIGLIFKCQHALVIGNPSEPVGRDSHLDAKPSILENRSTEMIQFAQSLGAIGLNMPATSSLRYYTTMSTAKRYRV